MSVLTVHDEGETALKRCASFISDARETRDVVESRLRTPKPDLHRIDVRVACPRTQMVDLGSAVAVACRETGPKRREIDKEKGRRRRLVSAVLGRRSFAGLALYAEPSVRRLGTPFYVSNQKSRATTHFHVRRRSICGKAAAAFPVGHSHNCGARGLAGQGSLDGRNQRLGHHTTGSITMYLVAHKAGPHTVPICRL